nr:MAG TPA: hypothetical protein [Bacteriophage sp.]
MCFSHTDTSPNMSVQFIQRPFCSLNTCSKTSTLYVFLTHGHFPKYVRPPRTHTDRDVHCTHTADKILVQCAQLSD